MSSDLATHYDYNDQADKVFSEYFGAPLTVFSVTIDGFHPESGWVPVTRSTVFLVSELRNAKRKGWTAFAATYQGRTADFQVEELLP